MRPGAPEAREGSVEPLSYVLMLTRRCNFGCAYCYQSRSAIDLDPAVLERVARSIRAGARPDTEVILHGGEPLLRKDLLRRAVELLSDQDGRPLVRFAIVTNGSLLDDETIELLAGGRFRIDVSFDGVLEAQRSRDAASFERLTATLRTLVARDAAGDVELRTAATVTLENLPLLARSVAFLEELGVPRILIEGDHYGPWVPGTEREVERQVERIARRMERRAARGLPVPVARLAPMPYRLPGSDDPLEEPAAERAERERRLDGPECSCALAGAGVLDADGSAWACPVLAPGLGRVAPERLTDPDAFRLGPPGASEIPLHPPAARRAAMLREPLMVAKRRRWSIFGRCADCLFAASCSVCPAASHLPGAEKPPEEVAPLACALHLAFASRRQRLRRPPNLMDLVRAQVEAEAAP